MALDRQSIEKRDFPIGRRGYDPDAVDAHLAVLADEVESLKRSAGRQRGTDTLAAAASEQVRLIVEAAEQSAADIEREAELEARQIRQDAREAAERMRGESGREARDHVTRVSEASGTMLERVDAIETELRGLVENLRSSATRVSSDLSLLQASVSELRGGGVDAPAAIRSGGQRIVADEPAGIAEPADAVGDVEPLGAEADGDGQEADAGGDEEGARLIALNMALNGTPREETERYLADNFDLEDPDSLLDDVYARAGQ